MVRQRGNGPPTSPQIDRPANAPLYLNAPSPVGNRGGGAGSGLWLGITMARFVAEISLPAPVYMPIGERKPLGQIAHYGSKKAYWKMDTEMDSNGTPKPLGICLTMELEATDLETAEDAELDAGLRFSQVLAAYSGSPLQASKLTRVARVGESEGLLDQFNYYYLEGPDALPRVMLRPYQLENLLSWFGSLNERAAYPLELAARWYGMSVGV